MLWGPPRGPPCRVGPSDPKGCSCKARGGRKRRGSGLTGQDTGSKMSYLKAANRGQPAPHSDKEKGRRLAELRQTVLTPCAPGRSAERRETQGTLTEPPGVGGSSFVAPGLAEAIVCTRPENNWPFTLHNMQGTEPHTWTHNLHCLHTLGSPQSLSRSKIAASGLRSLEGWQEGSG